MIFIYVFYVDLFMEQTFLMNFIVLSLVHIFYNLEGAKRYVQRMMAAFTGAAASAAVLVWFSYILYVLVTALVLVPLMIRIASGKMPPRHMIRCIGLSWLSMIVVEGFVAAIHQWFGTESLTIYGGLLVLMVAGASVRMLITSITHQKNRIRVVLSHRGKYASCVGLYDSGNRLKMPGSGEAVHIISPELLVTLDADVTSARMIPFHALGTNRGEIPVVRLEKMQLSCGSRSWCYRNVWMGCAGEELLRNMDYQMILNSAIWKGC